MEVYLIRHGQTADNVTKSHCGWGTTGLTEEGKTQAAEAKKMLERTAFDRIYVSDLARTWQTAEIIFPERDLIPEPRMREHHVGILEYQKVSDCMEKYGQAYADARARDDFSRFQGETAEEITGRVADFMKTLEMTQKEEHPPQKIAVVCHGGSIYHAFCYVLGMTLPKEKLPITNCSVTKFIVENGRWRVEFWNRTSQNP